MQASETAGNATTPTKTPVTPVKTRISTSFGRGQWNSDEWIMAKRPDVDNEAPWVQHEDYISNEKEVVESKLVEGHTPKPSAHNSMVNKQKISGDFTATATMMFEDKQAPSIMLAQVLEQDTQGRTQYQEHVEVVMYHQGINVWRHHFKNGKSNWAKLMYVRFPLEKAKPYTLAVTRKGTEINISIDGHICGYRDERLANELYLGVTADEGVNRIYNFEVKQ